MAQTIPEKEQLLIVEKYTFYMENVIHYTLKRRRPKSFKRSYNVLF